jgi:hypothetical protein
MGPVDIAAVAVSSIIGVIGLYLAHGLRRQQSLRVAEQRLDAYRKLWALMEIARPTRTDPADGSGPLTRGEAHQLYRDMPHWYFGSGNGMLLAHRTRRFYLKARENLGAYAVGQDPDWQFEGERCLKDLSLLRRQMALDLDIYGGYYFAELGPGDKAFLRAAGANPKRWGRPPWYRRLLPFARGESVVTPSTAVEKLLPPTHPRA